MELLKIFSEVIVASKCGPLASIEEQAVIKTGPTELTDLSGPQLKIKNQILALTLDLHKRSSKIREDFASDPQLNMI